MATRWSAQYAASCSAGGTWPKAEWSRPLFHQWSQAAVLLWNLGDVTLDGSSSVRDNVASSAGGGIHGGQSISVLGSSVVTGNQATVGGGLCSHAWTRVTAACGPCGNVYGNTPDDCYLE